MKHLSQLLFLFLSVFLLSCETEEAPEPDNSIIEWKSGTAPIFTLVKGNSNETDSLLIEGNDREGKILLRVKFSGLGKYKLSEVGTVTYYKLDSNGEITGAYKINKDDEDSDLEIVAWDATTNNLEINFKVTLKKISSGNTTLEETFLFTGRGLKGKAITRVPSILGKTIIPWTHVKAPRIYLGKDAPTVDSLGFHLYHKTGTIIMLVNFKGVGAYTSIPTVQGFYYEYEGGVIKHVYFIGPETEVNITEWNPSTKRIKGTFDITLTRAIGPTAADVDVIQFKGGTFDEVVNN